MSKPEESSAAPVESKPKESAPAPVESKPEESSAAPVGSKPEESSAAPVESKPEESAPTPVESKPEESSEPEESLVDEKMAEEFDQYVHDSFVETIEGDYTAYHIYFRHPENYGLDINNVEVGYGWRPTEEALAETHEGLDEMLEEFNAFDREKLRDDQKLIYDIMRWQVDFNIESSDPKFDYYGSYFESASGIHYQLATLFSDWKVHDEAEVKELITLLADTKPYIDVLLDYTRKQEEMGLLMIDLDDVMEHCSGILEKGMDSSVLTSMYKAIEGVGLSEELTAQYKDEVKTAFEESFLPAYQDIYDAMVQFKVNGKNNELGLASLPDGKEYYNLLIKHETGLDVNADQLWSMLNKTVNSTLASLTKYVTPYSAALAASTGYDNYRDILDDIYEAMKADFPDVGTIDYNIVDLDEEVASDSGIAAYFNVPTIDSDETREMRVNPHNSFLCLGFNILRIPSRPALNSFLGDSFQIRQNFTGTIPYDLLSAVILLYEENGHLSYIVFDRQFLSLGVFYKDFRERNVLFCHVPYRQFAVLAGMRS